jgi:hypothetical protein
MARGERLPAGRWRPRPLVCAAVLAVAALPGGSARAAWDGTQGVRLGDRVAAELGGPPGSVEHRFAFYAPERVRITARVRGSRGLTAVVGLLDDGLQPVNLGSAARRDGMRDFVPSARGTYSFRVLATEGAGRYSVTTRAVYARQQKARLTTSATFEFGAPAGSRVSATVRAVPGGGASPSIARLEGPRGAVPGVEPGASSLRRVPVDDDGRYVITVANAGASKSAIDVTVHVVPPAGGRTWAFGAADAPRGDATAIRARWLGSGHADLAAEAWRHWDDAIPRVVDSECARCHSGAGFEGFVATGAVATAPEVGRTIDCGGCHAAAAAALREVTFPSGQTVRGLGPDARCMTCHQGRESTRSVEVAIAAAGVADDVPTTALGFRNVHYFAAGATLLGREAQGAYEYADPSYATSTATDPATGLRRRRPYDRRFQHVGGSDTCLGCHDPHTLELDVGACAACHVAADRRPVASVADLCEIRMDGTTEDFDGDGNATEGVFHEMETLAAVLYDRIRDYARDVLLRPIVYDGSAYPYFYEDTNDNGAHDMGEAAYPSWSPRLLRAAYNYEYCRNDPGAFAHNAKYVLEVLYDSVADLARVRPFDGFAKLVRNDRGHFDSSADAYRDWDTAGLEGTTPAACSRCHSTEGFRYHVANQGERNQPFSAALTSGMVCESCHADGANFSPVDNPGGPRLVHVAKAVFPYVDQATSASAVPSTGPEIGGVTIVNSPDPTVTPGSAVPPDASFLCTTCHQGRHSRLTLDAYLATRFAQDHPQRLTPQDVHALVAGATQYSTKAGVWVPWSDVPDADGTPFPASRTYQGPWTHAAEAPWVPFTAATKADPSNPGGPKLRDPGNDTGGMPGAAQCAFCHMQGGSHRFDVPAGSECAPCHDGTDVGAWREGEGVRGGSPMATDFDGDPRTARLADEVAAFRAELLRAMNAWASRAGKPVLVHDAAVSPYWFASAVADGTPDDVHGPSSASPNDSGPDGVVDQHDVYDRFDRPLLLAAHDFRCAVQDPGAWAHNGRFALQVLYDAIDLMDDGRWNSSPRNAATGAVLVRPVATY